MITFGILIAYCICIGTRGLTQHGAEWRIPNALTIVFALFLGIGMIFCPESPRWLFFQGRHEEAEKSLARTRGVKVEDNDYSVRQTYEDMKMAVESEMARERFRWIDCFQPRDKILYRTVLLGVLQAGQQLTGANYCASLVRLLVPPLVLIFPPSSLLLRRRNLPGCRHQRLVRRTDYPRRRQLCESSPDRLFACPETLLTLATGTAGLYFVRRAAGFSVAPSADAFAFMTASVSTLWSASVAGGRSSS